MSLKEFAMNNLGIRPGLVQSTVAKFENGTKNGAADGAQKQSPARSKGQLDGLSSFKGPTARRRLRLRRRATSPACRGARGTSVHRC
ncbi:hypothetical protein OWT26_09960 [Burkholderia sp. 1A5]